MAALSGPVEMGDPDRVVHLPPLAVLELDFRFRRLSRFFNILSCERYIVLISDALRLIRVFHDLKQQNLADKLGISKSYLSEIESGKKSPSLDLIGKYSIIFSIPPSSIMFFSENMEGGSGKKTEDRAKSAIAGKIIRFLKFIEDKTDENQEGVRLQG